MQYQKAALSFTEIVQGRDSSVRVTANDLADVVDLVMAVTGKNCNHSNEVLRNMNHSLFDTEKFVIQNGRRYLTLKDAITLIMVLPGKMAKDIRGQFAEIIKDYIKNNLETSEIIPREETEYPIGFKRRREELELFKLEEEIKVMIVETRAKELARIVSLERELQRISDTTATKLDERTRLLLKDTYVNMLLNSQSPLLAPGHTLAITNGPSPNAPISISSVAAVLGYKPTSDDSKRIGMDLRHRYVQQHGNPPPKHDQLCNGRVTSVNSYTEQDRPLMTKALQAYFGVSDNEDAAE